MAVTWVGSDSGLVTTQDHADVVLTVPGGIAEDDFMLVYQFFADNRVDHTIAGGAFTQLFDVETGTGEDRASAMHYKFAGASEGNVTAEWAATSGGAGDYHGAALLVFRGVDLTTPIDNSYTEDDVSSGFNAANPAITTLTDNCAIVLTNSHPQSPLTAISPPTNYTLAESTTTTNVQFTTAYRLDAGATGTKTPGLWNNTGTGAADPYKHTVALRAATAAGTSDVIRRNPIRALIVR